MKKKIIIETKQVKKVKEILDRENIEYKFCNLETPYKTKTSLSKRKNIEEVVKEFDRARIKY